MCQGKWMMFHIVPGDLFHGRPFNTCESTRMSVSARFSHSTNIKVANMNLDRIEGNWKQLKGGAQQMWGIFTCDHFEVISGRRVRQSGKAQESYGISRDYAGKLLAARQVCRK